MMYRVGDKIKIKDLDWYNANCKNGKYISCKGLLFTAEMKSFLGRVLTVKKSYGNDFTVEEDTKSIYTFNNSMVESLESKYIDSFTLDELIESIKRRGFKGVLEAVIGTNIIEI